MPTERKVRLRLAFMINLKSTDYLPIMERWLSGPHNADTIGRIGHMLDRYFTCRAVPMPDGEDAAEWGYYNWRVTELWWHTSPMAISTSLGERWPTEGSYNEMTGRPGTDPRAPGWAPFSETGGFMPREYTDDFKGKAPTLDDAPFLRWVVAHRYPDGIDVEEADDWWVNVHVPEVCEQAGLRRFVSTKFREFPPVSPMVRWSEYWYDNGSSWVNAMKNPPKYTEPPWASRPRYPFLLPYTEFTSTFLLEAPSEDFLRTWTGYVPAP